jgi:hypothetical protein
VLLPGSKNSHGYTLLTDWASKFWAQKKARGTGLFCREAVLRSLMMVADGIALFHLGAVNE